MADIYTTKQGDMWDAIAYKVYGNEYKMHYLMDANKAHVETVIFPAGLKLTVPTLSASETTNLPPWKRGSS